jgi:hypothetical protein
VIISEWMGYMLLYEFFFSTQFLFIAFQCALTIAAKCPIYWFKSFTNLNMISWSG